MGHNLIHPRNLQAWRRWSARQQPVRSTARRLKSTLKPPIPEPIEIIGEPDAAILVAVEATHASVSNAVVEPLRHLPDDDVAIICPPGWQLPSHHTGHRDRPRTPTTLDEMRLRPRLVLAAGHYTPIGAAAHRVALESRATFVVSQHGLLTPYVPPLPPGAHLLAWSEADANFWASGRSDVTQEVVGSQLFHAFGAFGAFGSRGGPGGPDTTARSSRSYSRDEGHIETPVFLGQLHGAELPRRQLARAATEFCQLSGATYRPHPSERDRLSRLQHALWERRGITVDRRGVPLRETQQPVVSVFSTGVLEAASLGLPSWVSCPDPPPWLVDFWDRYGMRQWGEEPTPAPDVPSVEPAAAIARALEGML